MEIPSNLNPHQGQNEQRKFSFPGKKILVVEDDPSNYLFLESLLKRASLEINWAKDGAEAIDFFKQNRDIDLILMDIRLPNMNGLRATEEIRKMDDKIPIIAQTAYAFTDDKQKSLDAGCTSYISKPIRINVLRDLLFQYL